MKANTGSPYDAAINELETRIAEFQRTLDTLKLLRASSAGGRQGEGGQSSVIRHRETEISHDTFFNMTIAEAARKYLSMTTVSKSTAAICRALEDGGLKHTSKNFATTVRSILGPRPEFTRVPNGDWGLSEWYGGKKLKAEKVAKKKKRRKPKTKAKAKVQQPDASVKKLESHPGGKGGAEKPEGGQSESAA